MAVTPLYFSLVIGHYSFIKGGRMNGEYQVTNVSHQGKDWLANELENRLIDFAVRIIKVTERLPSNSAGNHIARQLM